MHFQSYLSAASAFLLVFLSFTMASPSTGPDPASYNLKLFPFELLKNHFFDVAKKQMTHYVQHGDQLEWPEWAMLQRATAGMHFPLIEGEETLGDDPAASSLSSVVQPSSLKNLDERSIRTNVLRRLGLCHFKICPVGKRFPEPEEENAVLGRRHE